MSNDSLFPSELDSFDEVGYFGSLGFLDELFGVDDLLAPFYVRQSISLLCGVWGCFFLIELLFSSILTGDLMSNVIPRVALGMGCLYKYIDPYYIVFPRMFTCCYLHYNSMHFIMNSLSTFGSIESWQRGLNIKDLEKKQFIFYYFYPVWFLCSFIGSFISYKSHLGKTGSFTIGASGGVCGLQSFTILQMIMKSNLSESERMALIINIGTMLYQILPMAPTHNGQAIDFASHGGGAALGLILSLFCSKIDQEWNEIDKRRFGVILIILCIFVTLITFIEVFRQFITAHSDRLTRAYFKWYKIDQIRLKSKRIGEPRRWTIADIQGIDSKINLNAKDGPRKTEQEENDLRRLMMEPEEDDLRRLFKRQSY